MEESGLKIPLVFDYKRDVILDAVMLETSLLSNSIRDAAGNARLELVMDDDFAAGVKFRELFFDAQSEVMRVVQAYTRDVSALDIYRDSDDFSDENDFFFTLMMPPGFNLNMAKPLNQKIREYIVAYICYRWLELRDAECAAVYFSRLERAIQAIGVLLGSRTGNGVRSTGLWD